ncbi:hypothetical protein FA95DRAFT_1497369 [Auriscalpium vulgare]|uniref:Uncharacterized protein n=1 Tax=Auriscalpium vulgare TaxID=40419 RepID=A0ACB8RJ23_9AGAM|nr:hypothetical protein FA95DRAFT_1497369 [Auriscalpium vulgare]
MASELITQTLAELPQTPSPTKPSSKARASETARSGSPTARAKSLRSASGGSRSAPGAPGKGAGTGAHVSASGSNSSGAASGSGSGNGKKKTVSLKVLKSCTIFVDVKTGSGDDAGGLFVDMLRGLGARILGSAGSTCTHIVFKNGAAGTLTRYRLMDEPKPFVVGIAWVVECVEQMTKVDESKFLVDLEHLYVAGGNKVCAPLFHHHIGNSAVSIYAAASLNAPEATAVYHAAYASQRLDATPSHSA